MDTGKKSLGEDWSFFLESPKSTALYAVPSLLERALHTLNIGYTSMRKQLQASILALEHDEPVFEKRRGPDS